MKRLKLTKRERYIIQKSFVEKQNRSCIYNMEKYEIRYLDIITALKCHYNRLIKQLTYARSINSIEIVEEIEEEQKTTLKIIKKIEGIDVDLNELVIVRF